MAWCRQATSHYLNHCWPRSMSLYGVTRPQWDNSSLPWQNGRHFANDIFRYIFVNEKFCVLDTFSLKFFLQGSIANNPALVDNGLSLNRQQAIVCTNADLIHWRIYVALGEINELIATQDVMSFVNQVMKLNFQDLMMLSAKWLYKGSIVQRQLQDDHLSLGIWTDIKDLT